jgi:rubrerythrin
MPNPGNYYQRTASYDIPAPFYCKVCRKSTAWGYVIKVRRKVVRCPQCGATYESRWSGLRLL